MSPSRQSSPAHQTTKTTTTQTLVGSLLTPEGHLLNIHNVDSEISSDDEDTSPVEESLTDRLLALRDMIPPTTRSYISSTVSTTTSYIKSGLGMGGKALFVLSTSALLLGVPWALAFAEEQQVVEMEKEMRMREMGSEVSFLNFWGRLNMAILLTRCLQILTPGTNTAGALNAQLGAQQGRPAL
jgi:mitochondrial import receptor subunit TOM22